MASFFTSKINYSNSLSLKALFLWLLFGWMMIWTVETLGAYGTFPREEPEDSLKRIIYLPPAGPRSASGDALRAAMRSRMKSQLLDSCMPYSDVICKSWGIVTKWTDGRVNRSYFRKIKKSSASIHEREGGETAFVVSWHDKEQTLIDFAAFESVEKK